MMAKPMKTLESHYPTIQFLIIDVMVWLSKRLCLLFYVRSGMMHKIKRCNYTDVLPLFFKTVEGYG